MDYLRKKYSDKRGMFNVEKNPIVLTDDEMFAMHQVQLNMMKIFDKICRKNNIKYILEGGSLLGAVRHKGFIPWDADMDVRMLRDDYEKFYEAASYELPEEITFQDYRNDPGYPWLYGKLRMKGTKAVRVGQERFKMQDGIWIDIFPCDGVPNEQKVKRRHNRIAKFCRKTLYARSARYTCKKLYERVWWTAVCIVPRKIVYALYEYLVRKYNENNCSKVGIIGWHGIEDVEGFPLRYFTELTELEFEGCHFYGPKDWDGYLRYTFGNNYMEVPPIEKQVQEHGIIVFDLGK